MLAAAGGAHDRARPPLEDAVDGFERSGGPFEAAEARLQLAATLAALGRADAARGEVGIVVERLSALGAGHAADQARRMLRTCERDAGRSPLGELTARERAVLRLVAGGSTNLQIAQRLVVSEHTVHRHVTNILRKLDLPSRTAAAVWAVRSGLLDAVRE
jgi:DNA-binding NarL/FixJ family response regulator